MRKNEKIPVPETEPDKINLEYFCPAASWGDMTGLIPANNSPETVSEAYEELYPYIAPVE